VPQIEEVFIKSVSEYLLAIKDRHALLYRGVTKSSYLLIPSVARDIQPNVDLTNYEIEFLKRFREQATSHIDTSQKTEWDLLMLAQHHGMQTRLLDWTENPFVALYFACEKDFSDDGKVYRLDNMEHLDTAKFKNPFDIPRSFIIRAPHISPRIAAQSAYFTVSKTPKLPLEEDPNFLELVNYHRIIIPHNEKESILYELNRYGINHAVLFPGLDGLSKKLNFELSFLIKRINDSFVVKF
jgi:hypothetical protein